MKKYFLIITFLFVFFLTDNVFASSIEPLEFYIDNTALINAWGHTSNTFTLYTNPSNGNSSSFTVRAISRDTTVFKNYPYVVIYFKSSAENIAVSRNSTCNQSCFSSDIQVSKIGKSIFDWGNCYLYALVLPVSKQYSDYDASIVKVEDFLTLTSWDNVTRPYVIYSAYYSDTNPLIDNSFSNYQELLNSQNQNAQNIINNNNTNTNNIINNNTSNANNIINNQNQNQQQTNQKLDSLNQQQQATNNFLTDNTAPTSDVSVLGNVHGLLPPGPVDSLLNIPLDFLSIVTNSCSGTCVPLTGKFVFDSTLTIPCFNTFYDEVPEYLMFFINVIPSVFILLPYFKHLYKKVERAVSMETTSDDEWGVL